MATTYYALNSSGTNWIETPLNDINISYAWINLYNDDLSFRGIGMYPKKL